MVTRQQSLPWLIKIVLELYAPHTVIRLPKTQPTYFSLQPSTPMKNLTGEQRGQQLSHSHILVSGGVWLLSLFSRQTEKSPTERELPGQDLGQGLQERQGGAIPGQSDCLHLHPTPPATSSKRAETMAIPMDCIPAYHLQPSLLLNGAELSKS